MKIIHQGGFTDDELMTYRPTIYRNTLDSAQAIVLAMRKIGLDCAEPSNRVRLIPSTSISTRTSLRHPRPTQTVSLTTELTLHPALSFLLKSPTPSTSCGWTQLFQSLWTIPANFT